MVKIAEISSEQVKKRSISCYVFFLYANSDDDSLPKATAPSHLSTKLQAELSPETADEMFASSLRPPVDADGIHLVLKELFYQDLNGGPSNALISPLFG